MVGDRVFAAPDHVAAPHGWQITSRRGGLVRSYRDPRFDTLRLCTACDGSGEADGEPCAASGGTGRAARAACREGRPR